MADLKWLSGDRGLSFWRYVMDVDAEKSIELLKGYQMGNGIFGLSIAVLLVLFIIYWLPVIWVLVSDRTSGVEKFAWFLAAFFFSWVGLIAFLLLAPPSGGGRPNGYP